MKLNGIEACRGIAALLVVLRHATIMLADPVGHHALPFGGLFLFGRAGVEFFFVLSGFIIMYVHQGDIGAPSSFAGFWRKRVFRIYPPYWIATAMLGAILVFSPTRDRAEQDLMHVFASITLLPEMHWPILDVGWSLRHEMLFYLLFSIVILNRSAGIFVFGCWFLCIGANLAFQVTEGHSYFSGEAGDLLFRGFNIEFLFGIGVAFLVRRRAVAPVVFIGLGAAVFVSNGFYESFGPDAAEWPPRVLFYALGAAMIIYGTAAIDRQGGWSIPRPLIALGQASYSIYLVHVTILLVVAQVVRRLWVYVAMPVEIAFVGAVATAVIGGICFSNLLEQPILRFSRRGFKLA